MTREELRAAIPKDPAENAEFRLALLEACRDNSVMQAGVLKACEQDVHFFINLFGMQLNPDKPDCEVGPFILYPFQEDALDETIDHFLAKRKDVVWEKSRKLGATWLALFLDDHHCLFKSWKRFLLISHMEAAVTADEEGSLFGKLEFIHRYLPDWMLRGAVLSSKKAGFNFPATNSRTTGGATTERVGVGDRANVILDEFAKQRDDYKILGQTADTGPRLFISTHYGGETAFESLTRRPDIKKIVMHWSHHPEFGAGAYRADPDRPGQPLIIDKTYRFPPHYEFVLDGTPTGGPFPGIRSPWYDAECRRRQNRHDVAMHLDIDPLGATKQFFDPLLIRRCITESAKLPAWRGDVVYDRHTGVFQGLVPRADGPLKLWVQPKSDGRLPASRYGVGGDISQGQGTTPSCLSGIDGPKGLKVLEYSNSTLDPKEFAVFALAVCGMLLDAEGQGAKLGWESAGPTGKAFENKVLELGYRNVYVNGEEIRWNSRYAAASAGEKYGWYPSNEAKLALLLSYKEALYERRLINRSEDSLKDCLNFEYDGQGHPTHAKALRSKDPTAARHNHGDQVIADGIAWLIVKEMGEGGRQSERAKQGWPTGSLGWLMERGRRDDVEVRQWV